MSDLLSMSDRNVFTELAELTSPDYSAGNTADITATGTLPNGAPVILKTDGTVEAVANALVTLPESIPAGSAATFVSGEARYIAAAFDPNNANQFVVTFVDHSNSDKPSACVGTVSGTSITFGEKVLVLSGSSPWNTASYSTDLAFDPDTPGQFVVCLREYGYDGCVVIGTVSGTSITFGAKTTFTTSQPAQLKIAFNPNTAGQFVIAYKDGGNSSYGTAVVGTVSGTSITFGSEVVFQSSSIKNLDITFDPNTAGQFVVVYMDYGNSNYGTAVVGTVSGTSITFGSGVVFNSSSTEHGAADFDPNTANQFVVCYKATGPTRFVAKVGTVSGTAISFGAETTMSVATDIEFPSVAFNPNTAGQFVVAYRGDNGGLSCLATVGTVTGTSISAGSEYVVNPLRPERNAVAFDPNTAGKFVICHDSYADGINNSRGVVGQLEASVMGSNATADNLIGTSAAAYADGETATVTLQGGVSSNQTGLTAGATYYVNMDGTLSATSAENSIEIGKAITSTHLLLKGL